MCSACCMTGELHPANAAQGLLNILHLDDSLKWVASFSGIATSITVPEEGRGEPSKLQTRRDERCRVKSMT